MFVDWIVTSYHENAFEVIWISFKKQLVPQLVIGSVITNKEVG